MRIVASSSALALFLASLLSLSSGMPTCGRGKFFNGKDCQLCRPGTYKSNQGTNPCLPCPVGTYNPHRGGQGMDVCIECEEGTFSKKVGAISKDVCKKCPGTTSSPSASSKCIFCPAGKHISVCPRRPNGLSFGKYRGQCTSCEVDGTSLACSVAAPFEPECLDCPPGTFSNKTNSLECEFCPDKTSSVKGATQCTAKQCPAGQDNTLGAGCRDCVGSTFNDGTMERCDVCPPGLIGNTVNGATKCVPCPAGTSKSELDIKCRSCKPGENSFAKGSALCVPDNTPCPSNHFINKNGGCSTCSLVERFDKSKKECIRCPKNNMSKGGIDTTCSPCPSGTILEEATSTPECTCRPGWGLGDGEGPLGGGCRKCPPGTASPGDIFCTACRESTFAPRAGMELCLPCPPGTNQPLIGQSKCMPNSNGQCKKGLRKNKDGICVNPATNCPPNHMRVSEGEYKDPYCNPLGCPSGLKPIRPLFNSFEIKCGECDGNTRFNPTSSRCDACQDPNSVSEVGVSETCEQCSNGMENIGGKCRCGNRKMMQNGKCVKCPPGTSGYSLVQGCQSCPPGTYSSESGAYSCSVCAPGTFSKAGARECQPCSEGTTTFAVGDAICVRVGSKAKSMKPDSQRS